MFTFTEVSDRTQLQNNQTLPLRWSQNAPLYFPSYHQLVRGMIVTVRREFANLERYKFPKYQIHPQAGCMVPPFIWSSSYPTFLQPSGLQSAFILIILFHTQTYLLKAFPDFLGQEAGDQNDELFSVQTSQS